MKTTIYHRNRHDKQLKRLKRSRTGAWVNIENISSEDLDAVCDRFELERNIVSDALDPYEVPRIERDDGMTYLFTRFAYQIADSIFTAPLLIVIGEKQLYTIANKPLPVVARFDTGLIDFYTTQKTKLLILLFLEINQDYQRLINQMSKTIRNLGFRLEEIENKDVSRFVQYESVFNDFIFGLEPMSITLQKLLSGKFVPLYEEDRELIEDLFLGTDQLLKIAVSNIKASKNIREAYSSIQSNNLNKTMKLLTSVTVLLTVPTVIGSFWGMNVPLPFETNPLGYVWVTLLMILVSIGFWAIFSKKDLL